MPQFFYKGRDKEGQMRTGQRFAPTLDNLNAELAKEGIFPIQIKEVVPKTAYMEKFRDFLQGKTVHLQELAIFSRQMQLLHHAGVPITTALKQLAVNTRSMKLARALQGLIEHIENGESMAAAMQYYPDAFSSMMASIVQVGEDSGHLSDAFGHLHEYLSFEANSIKQIRSAFRYPTFILVTIGFAIIVLNLFVIPTFAKFYTNLDVSLPWQTRILIGTSNFFVNYWLYILIACIIIGVLTYRYLHTAEGLYRWQKFQLHIPIIGDLLRRLILIRFTQSLSIMLGSGIAVNQSLALVKNVIGNAYIEEQISKAQGAIERGVPFTQAIAQVDLFTPLEIQILAVGEKNGELSPSLSYIGTFHGHEIEYDLKRMSDIIGPIMISVISLIILIMALGVYLPVWNMINLIHS